MKIVFNVTLFMFFLLKSLTAQISINKDSTSSVIDKRIELAPPDNKISLIKFGTKGGA